MQRRTFLSLSFTTLATPALVGRARAQAVAGRPLPIPQVVDIDESAGNRLEAIEGVHDFGHGAVPTLGWSQEYLGPTLRMRRGRAARLEVNNRLDRAVTAHWHGLHVPGRKDGGPQSLIAPGAMRQDVLNIDQPGGTYWYHSHPHGRTGEQVYRGLAGLLLVEDAAVGLEQLPSSYGVDDIPLIVQDKAFTRGGELAYDDDGMTAMQGFRGDRIVVNGTLSPSVEVPKGLVRFRLLNASNSRVYEFAFNDNRTFHQIAGDASLLPAPLQRRALRLTPAERAEILVDFSDGSDVRLTSRNVPVQMMGGMMGGGNDGMMGGGMMGRGMMGGGHESRGTPQSRFEVLQISVDPDRPGHVISLPDTITGAPSPDFGEPVRRRRFQLNMMMGMGMMRGMFGGRPSLGINGKSYDMERIDAQLRIGEPEIWEVSTDMMGHPFHVHGTSFQVLSQNGRAVDYAENGLKDVVWINGSAEILVRFDHPAGVGAPYMYHCHILEHEDAGMMGQFTVS